MNTYFGRERFRSVQNENDELCIIIIMVTIIMVHYYYQVTMAQNTSYFISEIYMSLNK